jgi:hypothetical protein
MIGSASRHRFRVVHPMERLRYVARSGGGDPASVVVDTVEALRSLSPGPGELVSVCRNLVDRAVACGPLWWLCSHLLADPDALATAWDLVDVIADDPSADVLANALPSDATVVTIGNPPVTAAALCRRGDLAVLAVDAGHATNSLVRRLDRCDVESTVIAPEAMLSAIRRADVVIVEADACSSDLVVATTGSGLAAIAADHVGVPVWLVAGRGRRLPGRYVDAIAARCEDDVESFPVRLVTNVAGPDGVRAHEPGLLASECPLAPELVSTKSRDKP